jgi:hypothetical protein
MSQVQTLTLEAQRPAVVFLREEDTRISPPLDRRPSQEAPPDASLERALGPAPSQPVFEAATVVQVTQTRRVSIIVLLVMANVVQVESLTFGLQQENTYHNSDNEH